MQRLFLSIGAMKAGTTWVYSFLSRHPEVYFTPEKEIHFLADHYSDHNPLTKQHLNRRLSARLKGIQHLRAERKISIQEWYEHVYIPGKKTVEWYKSLFNNQPTDHRWNADFSNLSALINRQGWQQIKHDISNQIKAIYILREPCERLWSQFKFSQKPNKQSTESQLIQQATTFLTTRSAKIHSQYCLNLDNARAGLGAENVKPLIFDDIQNKPTDFLRSIEQFLNISKCDYSNIGDLNRKINTTSNDSPPEQFRQLCESITYREIEGLDHRGIQVPQHWRPQ